MAKRTEPTGERDQQLTFEQALAELEEITGRMERPDVALEESLSLYERGTQLVRLCQQRLDAAEQRVLELNRGRDGELAAKPAD